MARKLPLGIQSFESIRRDGYVYVDKTAFVHMMEPIDAHVPTGRHSRDAKGCRGGRCFCDDSHRRVV